MNRRMLMLAFLLPAPLHAEALRCELFKSRIEQSVRDMGGFVAAPGGWTKSYDGGAETGDRYSWSGDPGLSGTMTCGKTGTFEDFGIAIDEAARTSDGLAIALDRFTELASASICALSEATATDCRALAKTMTLSSLAQFKEALTRGDAVPTGTRDFAITDGADAELDMTPNAISWSIGPGLSATMDAAKKPLTPRDVDKSERR